MISRKHEASRTGGNDFASNLVGRRAAAGSEFVISPPELELAQGTFNEAGAYQYIARLAAETRGGRRGLRVLDVCTATGLAAEHASAGLGVSSMVLVDIDAAPLAFARNRHEGRWPRLEVIHADAVEWGAGRTFDLIVANSAYHHIEDDRKRDFLRHLRGMLADGGSLLVGEHFLPACDGTHRGMREALAAFYGPLLDELARRGESAAATAVIRKAFELGLRGEVEFKVSWDWFRGDVEAAGLRIHDVIDIWSPGPANCGTRVVHLGPAWQVPMAVG